MASISVPCPKTSFSARLQGHTRLKLQLQQKQRVSFPHHLSSNPLVPSSPSGLLQHGKNQPGLWKAFAKLNEVAAEESSNSVPMLNANSKPALSEEKSGNAVPDQASFAAFMSQVSDIVKLVDSRDIVELQLKQHDCELIIRKKEALVQPAPTAAMPAMYSPAILSSPPQAGPVVAQASAPTSPPPSAPVPALPIPAKASTSSHPALKCPMAGTFYRCPGPGEPPFVKVGDKVQKGQVICIIEAMKLMNEIEVDRSGTVAEILVEDGKPVSVDMPLFLIAP